MFLKFPLLIYYTFFSYILYGQFSDYTWYFGPTVKGIQFDYNNNQPSVINYKYTPFGSEGCSVISNPINGILLYYSDGIRAIDKNHNIMPNGAGLLGNSSSAQNGLSCPVPGKCNQYYLFSNSAAFEVNSGGNLYYSLIDMDLPGNGSLAIPLGDIQSGSKNVSVISNTSEALSLIKGALKDEFWLLSHQYSSSIIRVLKITSSGIVLSGSYNIGSTIKDGRCISYSNISKKLCILGSHGLDPIVISDFDNATGIISNSMVIPGTPFFNTSVLYYGPYDSEWSEDGSKLYISLYRWYFTNSGGRLYQYDLNQPMSSPVLIFNNGGGLADMCRGLRRGPDNKIYLLYHSSTFNSTRYIGVINDPNQTGLLCDFNPVGLDMGSDLGNAHKFPDFLTSNNQKPIAIDDYIVTPTCFSAVTNINILLNDSDPDNDNLNVSILNVKSGNTALLSDNSIQYTPPADYFGNDTITYVLYDDACFSLTDTAQVVICVNTNCDNDPPLAQNDTVSICFDGGKSKTIYPLDNDSDPDNDILYISIVNKGKGGMILKSDNSLDYTSPYLYEGIDSITYILCDNSCNYTCDTAKIFFCIDYIELFIPNLITPNKDGKNDFFIIKGLYPNSLLQIYNRWGDKVYANDNYNNEWKAENVSDGIYYYIFNDTIREKQWRGWVQVLSKDL